MHVAFQRGKVKDGMPGRLFKTELLIAGFYEDVITNTSTTDHCAPLPSLFRAV